MGFIVVLGISRVLLADELLVLRESEETFYNCGVNAAYLAIRSMGISTSVERVARELRAGAKFERTVTMADVKRCFESHGLSVVGLKAQSTKQIESHVSPNGTVVARLGWRSSGQPQYHLVTLLGANDALILVDPPRPVRSIPRRRVTRDDYLRNLSGEFLVLTMPVQLANVTGPRAGFVSTEFDAGLVSANVPVIEVPVNCRNPGSETLRISRVAGPCDCFLGAEGTMEIAPGASGSIVLRFTPERLPAGKVERTVTLETNDPQARSVALTVRMTIGPASAQHAVLVSPSEVNLGRGSVAGLMSRFPLDLRITLLRELETKPTRISASSNASMIGVEQVEDHRRQQVDQSLMRIVHFRIVWKEPPPDGPFEHIVTFDIERAELGGRTLKVPIRGDVIGDVEPRSQHRGNQQ